MLGPAAQELVEEVVRVASRYGDKSIIVLSGTAGTGKTTFAFEAALRVAGHPLFVTQIQFHGSYSYEDFIEGLRPTEGAGFRPEPGVFLEINERAHRDPENQYLLLVEELSRANITNVLGELMTFLEHRDRAFVTPVTREEVRVAENLVMLATMNPRDRSALEVDEALIRRFRIIDCPPDSDQLREMLQGRRLTPQTVNQLAGMFDELREAHGQERFNALMPFGHGIFADVQEDDDLTDLWDHQIKHLLYRPLAPEHRLAAEIRRLYPGAAGEDGAT